MELNKCVRRMSIELTTKKSTNQALADVEVAVVPEEEVAVVEEQVAVEEVVVAVAPRADSKVAKRSSSSHIVTKAYSLLVAKKMHWSLVI